MSAPRPVDPDDFAVESVPVNVSAPLLDAKGAAEWLGVPSSWVLAEARADRIPHVRLGRYVRFRAEDLEAWVAARVRGPRGRRTGRRPVSATAGTRVAAGNNGAAAVGSTNSNTEELS